MSLLLNYHLILNRERVIPFKKLLSRETLDIQTTHQDMSDQPSDIGSFFDKFDKKKTKQQTQQQKDAKKAEERKKQEEEKKLQSTSSSKSQTAATAGGDFESSDEEENRGKIDIVGGGVKDIKQVKKEKQQQDKLKESDNQGWNLGPAQSSNAEAKAN